ncbi:hypothetical protein CHCC20335_2587 [Bacillus paralicheniformis]|nr:hypothetical protein CHCC20335_2587 [Bacillus paralicheniformis]
MIGEQKELIDRFPADLTRALLRTRPNETNRSFSKKKMSPSPLSLKIRPAT